MPTVLKAKPPTQRSEAREALRMRIEEATAATARRQALTTALAQAESSVRDANAAMEAAEADVETAKADAAQHLVATANGAGGDPPRTIRQARDVLQDCTDQLDACRAARDQLRQQLAEPDTGALYRLRVNEAIDAVLKAEASNEARAVVDAAQRARLELVRGILAVQYLASRNLVEQGGIALMSQYPLTDDWDAERDAATARWRQAVERLAADPDASLDL